MPIVALLVHITEFYSNTETAINICKGDSLSTSEVQFCLNIFSAAKLNISKITQRSRGRNRHFFTTLLHSNIAKFQSILLQGSWKPKCVLPGTNFSFQGHLGVHLCQKDPKLVKKWPSYGYFPTERLGDSIESHMGQKGTLGCSFKPKRSKNGQKMAELWLFSLWEVAWFHWEPHGIQGDPLVFICTKKDPKSV